MPGKSNLQIDLQMGVLDFDGASERFVRCESWRLYLAIRPRYGSCMGCKYMYSSTYNTCLFFQCSLLYW